MPLVRHVVRLISRASELVNTAVEWALALLGMSMAGVIGLQVVSRYAFNHSLFWSEELGRLILVWLTFLGASVAYKRGAHIGVDFLVNALGPGFRRVASVASLLAAILLFWIMTRYGLAFLDLLKFQWTTSLGVTRRVPFAMVPVGGAAMLLHALAALGEELFGRRP